MVNDDLLSVPSSMGNDDITEDPMLDNALITENEDGSITIETEEEEEKETEDFYKNIVEDLDQVTVNELAGDIEEAIEKDKEARKKRDEQYEEGLRRTGLGNDAPGGATFDGASKVVHPIMAEGCVDFAARAIKELMPSQGPVKTKVHGLGVDPALLDKAKRKRDFLNWQLTHEITEYRPEKERLLTQLPLGGSQYEKYWYDEALGRIRMEFVPVDKVLLPYSAGSFESSPRVTHVQEITKQEFDSRVKSGMYRNLTNKTEETDSPERTNAEKANDKIEGLSEDGYYSEDGLRTVYELTMWRDLEGESQPYIVVQDEPTGEILAIYRNWKEDDDKFLKQDWWVEDVFIPWRGAYGVGLPHLIGGLAAALTGGIRALLDSAHINNAPTMLKLKSGRVVGQNTQVDITQVTEIDGPAGITDIRNLAMPMPFNPPSAVLFQMVQYLDGAARGLISTGEEKLESVGDRTPVGTTMALIEQGSPVYSSIHARLHESQRKALKIICRLNYDYPNEENLARFGLTKEDFAENDDIEPVSDPNIFSEAQRYAQLQETVKLLQLFPDLKWNREEIAHRALDLLRVDGSNAVLPKTPDPISGNPVVENSAALKQIQLKIEHDQDHMEHMLAHLQFVMSPFGASNSLTPPIGLMIIMGHVQEHLAAFYVTTTQKLVQQMMLQGMPEGKATVQAQIQLIQSFTPPPAPPPPPSVQVPPGQPALPPAPPMPPPQHPLMQMIEQALSVVKSKQPPPPMPPEVQASIQIAKMDIDRKTQLDKANVQAKQASEDARQQLEGAKFQMDQMQQKFDQNMKQMRIMLEKSTAEATHQVELMKNEADNRQKQMTELMKNKDDNDTAILVEQMKQNLLSMQQTVTEALKGREESAGAVDLAPIMQQLHSTLVQSQESQKQDDHRTAQKAILEGLQGIQQHLAAPKMIIKDEQGRPIGIGPQS
jgi:hypothetical protein